jgi:endonuclease/exonuclease/phosphatase family metal-dependent hydrolase
VVRRVRFGRRDDVRRPSRWTGPPPLLLVATVAALVIAPFVADDTPASVPAARQAAAVSAAHTARTVEPRIVRTAELPKQGGQSGAGIAPVRLAPIDIGVATYNMFRNLPISEATADARLLTSHPEIDVVGWQEADPYRAVLHDLPGWTTKTFAQDPGSAELAVSWRTSEFRLVSAHVRKVALGLSWREGRYPFGNRYVAVVRLEHRDTGRVLTVLDTHLPQKIEDLADPGSWLSTINSIRARVQLDRLADIWQRAPGRWIVGTGDFNFDARSDARGRPVGGPRETLGNRAESTYQLLGDDIGPTHPPTARNIDYVWLDRSSLRDGLIDLRSQRVLGGYHSDHRPLLARLRLS